MARAGLTSVHSRCEDRLMKRVLGQFLAFLRAKHDVDVRADGRIFLLSGITSINLYVVLKANVDLFRMYGVQVIEDGALRQFAEILGTAFMSVVFFVLFVLCERIVVDRLTAKLRDVSIESS